MAYALARLGYERLSHSAYRMASLFPPIDITHRDSNFPGPVLGSDFPVEPPSPFHGMYAAVTRLNPATGASPSGDAGWYPEESLTVEQALLGFTRNGAYGWGKEKEMGAIEVGMLADWVVVDRDILKDRSGKGLRDVIVRETWVNGRKVFSLDGKESHESVVRTWVNALEEGLQRGWRSIKKWLSGNNRAEL